MIRSSRFVNQAVLVGNGRNFAAALIVPNFEQLESYAHIKGSISTPSQFCEDPRIIDLMERQVAAATPKLARYETVKKIVLLENELTVDGGELTPTLKIKRRVSMKSTRHIDKIYADSEKQMALYETLVCKALPNPPSACRAVRSRSSISSSRCFPLLYPPRLYRRVRA